MTDPHKWAIHGERLADDTPHVRVSLADVELPNHVRFTQYVFRMRRNAALAMTVVLDDAGERVLLMRRHSYRATHSFSCFAVMRLLRAMLPGRLWFARVWGGWRNPWKCGR